MNSITVAVVGAMASLASAQTSYRYVDLASLVSAPASQALGIGPNGDVVGIVNVPSEDNPTQTRAVLWRNGSAFVFNPFPGAASGTAYAIGGDGTIVGQARQYMGFSEPITAFAADPALGADLVNFLNSSNSNGARDINSAREAVGFIETGTVTPQADWIRRGMYYKIVGVQHQPSLLPTLGGPNSWCNSINEFSQMVGASNIANGPKRAFRYTLGGSMTQVSTFFGAASEAFDINDAGAMVGWALRPDGNGRAFLSTGGLAATDLGTLGGNGSEARSINNENEIVGSSWTADGKVHAFIHKEGTMRDLNDLVWGNPGVVLTHAMAINNDGKIAGYGWLNGQHRAFLLVPQCRGDFDGSGGTPDTTDIAAFFDAWLLGLASADVDNSGGTPDIADIAAFMESWLAGC